MDWRAPCLALLLVASLVELPARASQTWDPVDPAAYRPALLLTPDVADCDTAEPEDDSDPDALDALDPRPDRRPPPGPGNGALDRTDRDGQRILAFAPKAGPPTAR